MFKSILYSLLGLAAIAVVVFAIGSALFQVFKSNTAVVQISVGDSSPQGSQGEDSTRALSIVTLIPKDGIPAILDPPVHPRGRCPLIVRS